MRIAIISPYSQGPVRGNVITVQRISEALVQQGQVVALFPIDVLERSEIEKSLAFFAPDIIIAFHAYYCGEIACQEARRLGVPCVVTITGSDISESHFRKHVRTRTALEQASAVVCFDENLAALSLEHFPKCKERLSIIPQGVVCLPVDESTDSIIPADAYVVLLPAALRPVKNIEEALTALSPLSSQYSRLRLVIVGGIIDRGYADVICEQLKEAPFAVWLDEVSHKQMGTLYARADIVLNCSLYEGMPNSILEAMALGRPVVASDIPGNRSLISDKQTGWLYSGSAGLTATVEGLMGDPELCSKIGARARELVLSRFTPQIEAVSYIELFTSLRVVPSLDNQERCCA